MNDHAERLRALFAARDTIAAGLAEMEKQLSDELKAYSYAQGLKVPMRPEQARREIGMEMR